MKINKIIGFDKETSIKILELLEMEI